MYMAVRLSVFSSFRPHITLVECNETSAPAEVNLTLTKIRSFHLFKDTLLTN